MKLLLDTHVLVWALREPGLLSERVRQALQDRGNELLVSVIAAYEIELKRDRDPDLATLPAELTAVMRAMDVDWLPLTERHASLAGRLPRIHGDPFDRLMVAQAAVETATLVTKDRTIPAYGIPTLW